MSLSPNNKSSESLASLSLPGLANILLRNVRTIAISTLVVGALFFAVALLRPRYEATSSFTPSANAGGGDRLIGLAAQFGVPIGDLSTSESVDFYTELVKSRDLLRRVATSRYTFPSNPTGVDSLSGSLIELYEIDGKTEQERIQASIDRLIEDVGVRPRLTANIVYVTTRAPWPGLAEAINRELLDLINEFNLHRHQSQAAAERQFVEQRLAKAREDLTVAESAMERFLRANRRYQDSPQLTFEAARLQRRLDLQQQLYVSLAQRFEQARIDEVRNTPLITIVDSPAGSAQRTAGLLKRTAIGILLGVVLGVVIVVVLAYWGAQALIAPEDTAALRMTSREMVSAARKMLRRG